MNCYDADCASLPDGAPESKPRLQIIPSATSLKRPGPQECDIGDIIDHRALDNHGGWNVAHKNEEPGSSFLIS